MLDLHNSGNHSRNIFWAILRPEDQTSRNAANASKTNQGSAAEGTFPLSTDIVGLIGHASRDVCIGTSHDKEDAKVSNSVVAVEAHYRETNKGHDRVEDQDWRPSVILVAYPGRGKHENASESIWRSDQALRCANAESHAVTKYNGKKIGNGVCNGSQTSKRIVSISNRRLQHRRGSSRTH